MKKQSIVRLFWLLLVLILMGCNNQGQLNDTLSLVSYDSDWESGYAEYDCSLFVNESEIEDSCAKIYSGEDSFALLPLVAVIKGLGGVVDMVDSTHGRITLDDTILLLDIESGTLSKEGENFNILKLAPGARHAPVIKRADEELHVDSDSLKALFQFIIPAKIQIDIENKTVQVIADKCREG